MENNIPEIDPSKESFWNSKGLRSTFNYIIILSGLVLIVLGSYQIYQNFRENKASIRNNVSDGKNQEQSVEILKKTSNGVEVGDLAPVFSSYDIYGNEIYLSDFQNKKPVLLVFWATWCGYCVKELPDLKSFTQDYQNEVKVIAVSSGETRDIIKDYIEKKDINFLMLLDEKKDIWNTYLVRGTPAHFLIDTGGKIVSLRPGLSSREDLEMMISTLTEF